MLVGAGLYVGGMALYNQMKDGKGKQMLNKVKGQAQNKLENMM